MKEGITFIDYHWHDFFNIIMIGDYSVIFNKAFSDKSLKIEIEKESTLCQRKT